MPRQDQWTRSEKIIAIKLYRQKMRPSKIAEFLPGRSARGVTQMLGRAGCRYERKNLWTQADVDTVEEIIRGGGNYQACIEALPHRTVNSIRDLFKPRGRLRHLRRDVAVIRVFEQPTHPLKFTREQVQRARGERVA